MSRLVIETPSHAEQTFAQIADAVQRRIQVAPGDVCPLETAVGFFRMCASQSCGKCTPCRIGLGRLAADLEGVLEGAPVEHVMAEIDRTCTTLYETADCAIGFQAGRVGLAFTELLEADLTSHNERGICASEPQAVPCVKSCPSHVDIPAYISLVKEGRFADAVRVIRNDNPFPSVCAFICEHPCEETCRRGMIDSAVNIRAMKQYAVLNAGPVATPKKLPETGKSVAVVGAGPSGLTCAYYLALMGHKVAVFEQNDRPGGMLLFGIPRYRLPQDALDYDVEAILSLGVNMHYNTKVGTDVAFNELLEHYDAVFLSIGAHGAKDLGVEYETHEGVMPAVEFLHQASGGTPADLSGKHVVIVGGGNVAMDATRTAKRLGAASVRCVYRRRRTDMTALPEEINAAVEEGCEIVELMAPAKVAKGKNAPLALVCQPQMPGPYRSGRPTPVPTDAPEQSFECDVIIEAIGQAIESNYFEQQGLAMNRGKFAADEYGSTAAEKVFAGGDCLSGPATVIRSIDAGKAAAANIDHFLGFAHDVHDAVELPPATFDSKQPCGRVNIAERPSNERAADFAAVELPLEMKEAMQECNRCLRCDHYGMGALRGGRPAKW